jgi:hypothetical protein
MIHERKNQHPDFENTVCQDSCFTGIELLEQQTSSKLIRPFYPDFFYDELFFRISTRLSYRLIKESGLADWTGRQPTLSERWFRDIMYYIYLFPVAFMLISTTEIFSKLAGDLWDLIISLRQAAGSFLSVHEYERRFVVFIRHFQILVGPSFLFWDTFVTINK